MFTQARNAPVLHTWHPMWLYEMVESWIEPMKRGKILLLCGPWIGPVSQVIMRELYDPHMTLSEEYLMQQEFKRCVTDS